MTFYEKNLKRGCLAEKKMVSYDMSRKEDGVNSEETWKLE
jgi:hypothetical protein